MVLMAEASSDNAATHAAKFLHFSVCLVFKIGDLCVTGPHPLAGPQHGLQVNSIKQLKGLWHLTCESF